MTVQANTIAFSPDHVRADPRANDLSFPRLKLTRDEYARILCIEERPTVGWSHSLKAPKISNGVAVTETIKRRDNTTFTDFVMEFIGRPLCLGDPGILADKGVDPTNCPACKASTESGEVAAPARRFAMHVVKIATRPGTWEPRFPFNCEVLVWSFTDQTFTKLVNIVQQFGSLHGHDLMLGPCTDQTFQKFEIIPGPNALWQTDGNIAQTIVATYQQNQAPDLLAYCGRQVQRDWMAKDVEQVHRRWEIANGHGPAPLTYDPTQMAGSPGLGDGLSALLGGRPTSVPPTPATAGAPASAPPATAGLAGLLGAGANTFASPAQVSQVGLAAPGYPQQAQPYPPQAAPGYPQQAQPYPPQPPQGYPPAPPPYPTPGYPAQQPTSAPPAAGWPTQPPVSVPPQQQPQGAPDFAAMLAGVGMSPAAGAPTQNGVTVPAPPPVTPTSAADFQALLDGLRPGQ